MMKHVEGWRQSFDGVKLYTQYWEPDGSPKGVVCLVHGIGEHGGRYGHVGEAFAEAGYVLWSYDARGHGQSEGARGYIPNYLAFMRDINSSVVAAKEKYPQVPTFMYGHSMGGNKVLNYVLRYRPQIQATIVTSPWLRLAFAPPQSQLMLGKVMRAVYPAFTLDGGFEENTLSRDPAVDAAYYNDPYVHTKVTSQLFFDCYEAGFWALEHAHEFPTPLLLAHGDGDKITDYTASVEFAQKAPNCTFKQWAGLYHETHNEPEKDEVIAYNLSWLDSQLP